MPGVGIIDQILEQDKAQSKKQRHTAKRVFERLREEHGFPGGYTIVKDYVRLRKLSQREMFVPLEHPPGEAPADFGEAQVVIGGVERKAHYFVMELPQSDDCFVMAFPAETTEAFLEGHNQAFGYFGGVPRTILYDNTKLAVRQILGDGTRNKTRAFSEVLSSSVGAWQTWPMKRDTLSYHGYRFPPDIISHAVWLYHRFGVSFRDVEDLLAQRGITVSYEAIRLWCLTFGSVYARRLKRRQGRLGDIWHLDEVFVTIQGQRRYLWRAVDQDGDVIDILVQSRRDCRAATLFFRKLLKGQERTPGRLVTDKLSSYRAAHRAVMPSVAHRTDRYENNRAEVSHQPTRQRERQMRRFKSPGQAQRFLSVHGLVRNLFRVGRHLVRAVHHRELRGRSFLIWDAVTIAA